MSAVGLDRRPRWSVKDALARGDVGLAAWKLKRRLGASNDVTCLEAVGVALSQPEIDAYLAELATAPELVAALEQPGAQAASVADMLKLETTGRARALFLYVAVRALRPSVVVETGCFSGWDSTVILTALHRNGAGKLVTIDLPPQDVPLGSEMPAMRAGLAPGFLVPPSLRESWDLRIADVRLELPRVLAELQSVDVFFHDSDHSYSHVVWELASAWLHAPTGGLLVADDVSWNTAVPDFARGVGARVSMRRGSPNVAALARLGATS
jgi:predicted O-methyltransferase YrrM